MTEPKINSLNDLAGITLLNDEGKSVSFTDFIGKRVLLFAFPRAATPGCTVQACGFRDAFPKIEDAHATVLGISTDDPAALAKWKSSERLPYTLLSDPDHKALELLGAWGERSMFGKKYMGTIRSHWVFDEQGKLTQSEIHINPLSSIQKGVKALTSQKV